MAISKENVDGALAGLKVFEAVVDGIDPATGDVFIVSDLTEVNDPERVPAAYFGGISGVGTFMHPSPGDTAICTRVFPGGKGITQILRIVPKADRDPETVGAEPSGSTNAGTLGYPLKGLKSGDIRVYGTGGNRLELENGNRIGGGVFLGKKDGQGLHVVSNGRGNNAATMISDSISFVSDASRSSSKVIQRELPSENSKNTDIVPTNRLKTSIVNNGTRRGLYPGCEARNNAILGGVRNPGLTEYRFVVNEVAENEGFAGWDLEAQKLNSKYRSKLKGRSYEDSVSQRGSLHLSPHQIVEVVIGNVANRRGEVLDLNYNPVVIGSETGMPRGSDLQLLYEESRLKSRRGIGYHFQLSTNSLSGEIANSYDNFIFALDKEGALKVNIPATSNSGNVLYPAVADFYNEETGRVSSNYSFKRKYEKIPITLKNRNSGTIYPSDNETLAYSSVTDEGQRRYVGVRFSNDSNYFRGFSGTADEETEIRVNPTKYHNMYAAAELLIANTIKYISIPTDNAKCTGYLPGNPIGKTFELPIDDELGDFAEVPYMCTVRVDPGPPAINTGGGVIVAGREYVDDGNLPFSNDFSLAKGSGEITSSNVSNSGEPRLDPGGKSANISLEGSIEMSIGSDNEDKKSMLLDTAGAIVAWLGKDSNGRSLVLQTDGSALVNIGGANGDEFNKGSFDLRVNVNNKGFVGDEVSDSSASDYIISISENGLVIAGMNPGAPMVIRNEGNLSIESSTKLILSAQTVEMREGNRPARKSHKAPESADTPDAADLESVGRQISCLITELGKLTD